MLLLLLLLLFFAIVFSVPINIILFHQTNTLAELFIIARSDLSDDLM